MGRHQMQGTTLARRCNQNLSVRNIFVHERRLPSFALPQEKRPIFHTWTSAGLGPEACWRLSHSWRLCSSWLQVAPWRFA